MKPEIGNLKWGLLLALFLFGCGGATERKTVVLTFDDGPNPPFTDSLFQTLEDRQVKATFFLIGEQVKAHPATARKILAGGHEIGGHSNGWKSLLFQRRAAIEENLNQMEAEFAAVGITNLTLFRPPGGLLFPWQRKILKDRNWKQIGADVVVGDWKDVDASTIRDRVLKKVRPGSIIALHDGGGDRSATIAAVPLIIDGLKAKGYEFVTISELLQKVE